MLLVGEKKKKKNRYGVCDFRPSMLTVAALDTLIPYGPFESFRSGVFGPFDQKASQITFHETRFLLYWIPGKKNY